GGNKVLTKHVGSSEQTYEPTTAEEKQDKRNDIKAKGTLLMSLPNKDQLKFHSYQDAKLLMKAIEKMCGGNKESKKIPPSLCQSHKVSILTPLDLSKDIKPYTRLRSQRSIRLGSTSVIKNGNKVLTKHVGSSEQTYEPTTAEEKQDRRNEIKAKGTLLMSLPNKDQLKFHSYQDAKLLMKAIEKSTSSTNEVDTTASGVSTTHTQGGYDWSYKAEEATPTNSAFMAFTSSRSSSSSDSEIDSCSKTCMKAYADHKNEYDSLTFDYKKSQHNLFSYKAGLQSIEERLVHYKKIKVVFTEKINVLNPEFKLRDKVLAEYTQNLEKVEKERDELKLTLEKLQNSSNSLNTLLNSQNNRSTKRYHEVPPPLTGNYMPLKQDLRLIDEHFKKEPKYVMKNNFGPPIIEDCHSDDDSEDELSPTVEVKTVKPSVEKIESVKTPMETVKAIESHKPHKYYPRGNKRN
nr:hypothetical protein [Tanacetum cinerariifolium]